MCVCVCAILFVSLKHLVYMHPFIYSFIHSFFFIFIFLLLCCLFSYICYIISFHDCNTYILPSRCVNLHTSFIYIFCYYYSFVVGGTTHNHYQCYTATTISATTIITTIITISLLPLLLLSLLSLVLLLSLLSLLS